MVFNHLVHKPDNDHCSRSVRIPMFGEQFLRFPNCILGFIQVFGRFRFHKVNPEPSHSTSTAITILLQATPRGKFVSFVSFIQTKGTSLRSDAVASKCEYEHSGPDRSQAAS